MKLVKFKNFQIKVYKNHLNNRFEKLILYDDEEKIYLFFGKNQLMDELNGL